MLPPSQTYLLDTNILVHLVRRDALAMGIREHYAFSAAYVTLAVSIVTEGEIRSLALQFGWGPGRTARLDELLELAIIVPLDFKGVVSAYAEIDAHCRRTGRPMGENDTWIAATAHATDRDFDHLALAFIHRDWIDPHLR